MTQTLEPAPNRIADELTGRDYISYSAIGTYRQCPLRYFFKYVAGMPEEDVSSSLVLGGAIHSAIEFHFNELMIGNAAPDREALLSVFWDAWRDRGEEVAVQFAKGEDLASVASLAERILAAFCESELADPQGTILGVEETLRGELVPGVPDLLARLDLIVETDEAITVIDFKTSRSRWTAAQADDSAEQLLLYSELVRQLAPHKELRLEFAVLTKSVQPVAERFSVTHDPARVARTRQVAARVWRAIAAEHFYPAPSPIACGCCPYREPCRRWQG